MTKIGPDQVAGFKNIGQSGTESAALQQKLKDEENALNQLIAGYQGARTVFGQAPQMNVPEREKPNFQQGLVLTLADALMNIVDTSPRKFRQERQPGVQTFQGLKDQDFERKLQEENLRYQNEAQRIAASQRQAEVGLEGLKAGYEGAGRATDTARQGYQFERTQGFTEAQAIIENGFRQAGLNLDERQFNEQVRQFNAQETRLGRSAAEQMAANVPALIKAGFTPEQANKMAFADFMTAATTNDIKDLELKRTKELYDALPVSAEVKHTLWQREAEIESHDENMKTLRKQREVMGRNSRSQDPFAMMMFNDFRSDIGGEIEKANQNIDFYTNGLEEIRLGTGDYKFANDEARGLAIKTYKRKIEDWTTRRNDAISLRNEITRNAAGK